MAQKSGKIKTFIFTLILLVLVIVVFILVGRRGPAEIGRQKARGRRQAG